jgi:hypothetical protein
VHHLPRLAHLPDLQPMLAALAVDAVVAHREQAAADR